MYYVLVFVAAAVVGAADAVRGARRVVAGRPVRPVRAAASVSKAMA